ncbi:MAG: D-aminoacylase, partial [Verrucomicrobiae bacterium]|nr:D-aminoacylase [Verrucomicrobiae bacterium]
KEPEPPIDLIISGGQVIDGTGSAPFPADIGIHDGRIVAIGDLGRRSATERIDASGLVVSPGFIDLHTHCERDLLKFPDIQNYTRQGVTTVVGGNCGGSPYPIGEYLDQAEAKGIAVNLALLVGHNTVRREVMGTQNRYSRPDELARMQELVDRAMQEGAFGLSTGLLYIPGAYSDTREVVALAEVAARHGGFYATHMRNEGLKLVEGMTEALNVGREAGLPVHISHHKAVGKSMWGSSEKTLAMVDAAVAEGLDVTLDQYPYTASSTGLTVLFPAWSLEGGREEILKRLNDPDMRESIKEAIVRGIVFDRGGDDPASIVVASFESDKSLEGKNLAEITELYGKEPNSENAADTLIELFEKGDGTGIYHCIDEGDVERIMKHPLVMCASDGATREFGVSKPHPRNYGTYPRVLGEYVREKRILSLSGAIRKMTSLPAKRLGLTDRGILKEGAWADIVLFNPRTVIDTATWLEPHQYPKGMPYLIVNGTVVIKENEWTGTFPGKVL